MLYAGGVVAEVGFLRIVPPVSSPHQSTVCPHQGMPALSCSLIILLQLILLQPVRRAVFY
jgi:hypothetical protein